MGDLLVMSHVKTRPGREVAGELPAGHSAEILFFTGVRYYRMEEPVLAIVGKRAAVKRRSAAQRSAAKVKREALA